MSARAAIKQGDLKRAIRSLEASGKSVQGVRFNKDGSVDVLTGDRMAPLPSAETAEDAWDKALGLQ